MGLFSGSLTNTAALQAAIDAAGSGDPAIGYSATYPFGVIGPIFCLFAFARFVKPRLAAVPGSVKTLEIALSEPPCETVADLISSLPPGVELIAIRQGGANKLPEAHTRLTAGDAVLLVGAPETLEKTQLALGPAAPGTLIKDRKALDLVRVFVSRPEIVGTPLWKVAFPEGMDAKIAEVRRGDSLLFPHPDLLLEYGDCVGVVASREALPHIRRHFGDSLKSTAEFSYASVGLGMSLGVLLGLLKIPVPGLGSFSLGLAGGPLLVALVLGQFRRIGSLSWHIPLSANITLRNFGLTLFLAALGLGSGGPFVKTVSETGFMLPGIGAVIILAAMLVVLLLGQHVFKLSSDDLYGVASGAAGNPAILAYANRALQSDRVDAAYATIFPSMTIAKIICVQVVIGILHP
jgi:putative transport protein